MTQTLTVKLPDTVYQYLQEVAGATQQSIEQLVRQSIEGNLPPRMVDAPLEIQQELLKMQLYSPAQLRQIAESQLAPAQQQRHLELLEKNQQNTINAAERSELAELRRQADRQMLQKAYAWALLRWLGLPLPTLEELPIH